MDNHFIVLINLSSLVLGQHGAIFAMCSQDLQLLYIIL